MKRKYTVAGPFWTTPKIAKTTLPEPFWTGECIPSNEIGAGVYLRALYWQPHARRLIRETYSCWNHLQTGKCIGTQFEEVAFADYGKTAMHAVQIHDFLENKGLLSIILNSL